MRNEPVARLAIVLIALGQHLAVLDQKKAGDALMRQEIVQRMALLLEAIFNCRRRGGLGSRSGAADFVNV